jgi:hypothetical protein
MVKFVVFFFLQSVQDDKERALRLSEAVRIEVANKSSHTASVVHSDLLPSHSDTIANNCGPSVPIASKRKLAIDSDSLDSGLSGVGSSSKIARISAALCRDFVLKPTEI